MENNVIELVEKEDNIQLLPNKPNLNLTINEFINYKTILLILIQIIFFIGPKGIK